MKMSKQLGCLIGSLAVLAGSQLSAMPITGTVVFVGNAQINGVPAVSFINPAAVLIIPASGSFATEGAVPGSLSFGSISSSSQPQSLWSYSTPSGPFSFTLLDLAFGNTIVTGANPTFNLGGNGMISHPLYDTTPGVFSWSGSGSLQFTAAATAANVVPDGGTTVALLGGTLMGLGLLRRKLA